MKKLNTLAFAADQKLKKRENITKRQQYYLEKFK